MSLLNFIQNALLEDVGSGDHTSLACIPFNAQSKAKLVIKEDAVLAGVNIALEIFKTIDPLLNVSVLINDGALVKKGDVAFIVEGSSQKILTAERIVLNCMQRMSGIATLTHQAAELIKDLPCKLLDTRKTTPGFRLLEKMAVKIGGGENHRFGLFDMMMIKDNHIDYAGGIKNAIERCVEYQKQKNLTLKIEIETRNIEEVNQVLSVGKVNRIMLDNFTPKELATAVKLINNKYETEASGGITNITLRDYALTGVNFISMGALTHSAKNIDISLKAF